jgi:DNA-binding Lrp family transcriptional regulator
MKNSRRSDRDLAKAIGCSQPTVTRIRTKLEDKGIIKEYTMIPDFTKLGYQILAITFIRLNKDLSPEQIEKAREIARERMKNGPCEVLMLERGSGLSSDGVFITYHENYTSYLKFTDWLKRFDFLEMSGISSFLVDLKDEVRYAPLTFAALANHILQMKEEK